MIMLPRHALRRAGRGFRDRLRHAARTALITAAAQFTYGELDDMCARAAAYKRPCQVVFLPPLPATSTGKIMRRRLADAHPAQT
jgi:acyl-coenzyme A synthetase/AMP-(fatty) acid ligase